MNGEQSIAIEEALAALDELIAALPDNPASVDIEAEHTTVDNILDQLIEALAPEVSARLELLNGDRYWYA